MQPPIAELVTVVTSPGCVLSSDDKNLHPYCLIEESYPDSIVASRVILP